MKRNLLFFNTVLFTEEHLIVNTKEISYSDIDMIHLLVPKKGSDYGKTYSSTHFLTVFVITDTSFKISINLSNKKSEEMIEGIKKHIKDHIIEYYDSENPNFD